MAQTYYEELQQFLPGLSPDMPDSCIKLAELFRAQAFELHIRTLPAGEEKYYIPYMMNDALECLLILEQCRMTGRYLVDFKGITQAHMAKDGEVYLLVVRQGDDNVFTIWFSSIREEMTCYQYHRIGHFWVKGQEQWRQLVYIIGTIYEKYDYLGEAYCNESEKELLRLVEFPPFRMWSPIHESLEEKYPATYEGVTCMERLAKKAKDTRYLWLVKLYRYFPNRILEKMLAMRLLNPKRQRLYETIWQEVQSASEMYPERDYGARLNEEIRRKRKEIHAKMLEDGFEGMYPEYYKKQMQITVTEEHPFTVSMLEFEDFVFRVQFMVSKCGKHVKIGKNCGFFRGLGRIGQIEREET